MFIVEWYDHEGIQHEMAFDNQEDAKSEAAKLEEIFDHVAIVLGQHRTIVPKKQSNHPREDSHRKVAEEDGLWAY